jgi:hypothetical protein
MTKTKPMNLESLLDDVPLRSENPHVRAIARKEADLRARDQWEEQREQEIYAALATNPSQLDALADALVENPAINAAELAATRDELARIRSTRQAIAKALDTVRVDTMNLRAQLDSDACRLVTPIHRRNCRNTINALLALHRSIAVQQTLRDNLRDKGVTYTESLQPCFPAEWLAGTDDPYSRLHMFLFNAWEQGFINESEYTDLVRQRIAQLPIEQ